MTPLAAPDIPLAVPAAAAPALSPEVATPATVEDLASALDNQARAVLSGITFESGARSLGEAQTAALKPVAELMTARPDMAIVIVGHTDNAGDLAANIALSRARARAVRQALVESYGIAANRIDAEGVGFLLPRVPNTSPENRARNRRVEIILR